MGRRRAAVRAGTRRTSGSDSPQSCAERTSFWPALQAPEPKLVLRARALDRRPFDERLDDALLDRLLTLANELTGLGDLDARRRPRCPVAGHERPQRAGG